MRRPSILVLTSSKKRKLGLPRPFQRISSHVNPFFGEIAVSKMISLYRAFDSMICIIVSNGKQNSELILSTIEFLYYLHFSALSFH